MSSYGDYPGPGRSTVSDGEYPYAGGAYGGDPDEPAPVSPPVVIGRAQVPAPVGGPVGEEGRPATEPRRATRGDRIRKQALLRRKRTLLMAFAAFLILFGSTAVFGTYY